MNTRALSPRVSVVLPVYNGAAWLAGAIQCVLDQSFTDFELIVIDDGSRDESWAVISGFSDPRIRAIRQANRGLAATLNVGIGLARAPLVARQDQDDWMHPERLARQVGFMDAHPACAAVGTWAEIREDDKPSWRTHKHPMGNAALRLLLLFDNPFVHSSMLLRRDAVLAVGGYSEDRLRQPPEDYELWSRLSAGYEVGNIGALLTAYREVASSMSRTGDNPFQLNVLKISAENIFRVIGARYSLEKCVGLAHIYHAVDFGTGQKLSRGEALAMMREAAIGLAGDVDLWDEECRAEYARLVSLLKSRFVWRSWRKFIPSGLWSLVRNLRDVWRASVS